MNVTTTLSLESNIPTATLAIAGDLDYHTTDSAIDAVRRLLDENPTVSELRLDCVDLTFCDSAGLSGLIVIHDLAADRGVRFLLVGSPAHLQRLLDVTGVHDYFAETAVTEGDSEEADAPVAERGQH